jgi:hypothetical protein
LPKVRPPAAGQEELREPAQRRLLGRHAGLAQRLKHRREVEEVVPAQPAVRQKRSLQDAEHANAEVVEHRAVRVRVAVELAALRADVGAGQFQRREEPGERRRRGDGHGHRRQPHAGALEADAVARLPAYHEKAVAVERA